MQGTVRRPASGEQAEFDVVSRRRDLVVGSFPGYAECARCRRWRKTMVDPEAAPELAQIFHRVTHRHIVVTGQLRRIYRRLG